MENVQFSRVGKTYGTRHSVLQLQANAKVTEKDVMGAVRELLKEFGCTGCGMNGFDIHLQGLRPGADFASKISGFDSSRLVESLEFEPHEMLPNLGRNGLSS